MPLINTNFAGVITFSRTSGATWFNSAGVNVGIDFSTSSVAIGTGSKTFTLTATAGVDRSWATGDIVRISEQATPANFMDGTVTSYTASTQTLVVNVTATGGSGTIASWRVSNWMPRFDYDPATLAARGLLIEEARTNSIRNNTMQGAAAGTPGTNPTNWTVTAAQNGITKTIVGVGTENGISYVDIQYTTGGGNTSASGTIVVIGDLVTQVSAASGQTWTGSCYLKLQAGSTANLTSIVTNVGERTAAGSLLASTTSSISPTSAALATQRNVVTRTLTDAATERVSSSIFQASYASGVAIDITLRIGLPQLELGAFATSVIPTTTTALTRSADVASVNTLSPWYNATEGTLFAEVGYQQNTPSASQIAASFNDTTANNRWTLGFVNTGLGAALRNTSGAGLITTTTANTATVGATNKIALAISTGASLVLNGGTVATNPSYAAPTVTQLQLGNQLASAYLNGHLRRITYYPRRLTNAELVSITS